MDLENKLIKAYEEKSLKELVDAPVYALQGLSKKDAKLLDKAFNIETIKDLAELKYAQWAREICELADEEADADMSSFENKLIKKYEKKTPVQLAKAPVYALQGVSKKDADLLKEAFNIKNVRKLAELKFIDWAIEIVESERKTREKPAKKKEEKAQKEKKGLWKKIILVILMLGIIAFLIWKYCPEIKSFLYTEDKKIEDVKDEKTDITKEEKLQENEKDDVIEEKSEIKKEEETGTVHTVVVKDQLTEISKKYYGNFADWKLIYNANRDLIKNPHIIFPGQKLKIPDKSKK